MGAASTQKNATDSSNHAGGAPEHVGVYVMLQSQNLKHLRQESSRLRLSLHNEARGWINWLAMQDPGDVPYNLAAEWEHWRMYLATHELATELVGRGIISFS